MPLTHLLGHTPHSHTPTHTVYAAELDMNTCEHCRGLYIRSLFFPSPNTINSFRFKLKYTQRHSVPSSLLSSVGRSQADAVSGAKLLLGYQPYTRVPGRVALKVLSFSVSPLSQDKPAFRDVISQLELDPKCKGLSFSSFLILPFQRITRLKLLVQVEFALPSLTKDFWITPGIFLSSSCKWGLDTATINPGTGWSLSTESDIHCN